SGTDRVGILQNNRRKMIVCVAVVGHQNNPLYIQSFTEAEDALKLHHIVHCSLDVIDERVNNPSKSGTTLNEAFLGLLYPPLNYKVYGYLTNTKVKFIMVTTDLDVRDTDVRSVCFFYLPKLVHSFFFFFSYFSCALTVLQEVPCRIRGCRLKPFPCSWQKDHFPNLLRIRYQHCYLLLFQLMTLFIVCFCF
ncbi:unnamed protein product, partial [Brassica rapa subsp. trilocularis]